MSSKNMMHTIFFVIGTFSLYTIYVILSGLGYDPLGFKWNFATTGALGDSFGPLNTLMASVAAVSAIAAYLSQSTELKRIKENSEKESKISTKRDFESTFFNLVELFRNTVKEIDVTEYRASAARISHGRDAISFILNQSILRQDIHGSSLETKFKRTYTTYRDDLAHYFRLFYHIMLFVDSSEVNDKMFYTRLFRATLSDSEIIMIALNCIHGGGRQKLKPLVEKYSMLHNISAERAKTFEIPDKFHLSAFGDRKIGPDGHIDE